MCVHAADAFRHDDDRRTTRAREKEARAWAAAKADGAFTALGAEALAEAEAAADALPIPPGDPAEAAAAAEAALQPRQGAARPAVVRAARRRVRARVAAATRIGTRPRAEIAKLALDSLLQRHCSFGLPPPGAPLTPDHAPASVDETQELLTVIRYREYLDAHKCTKVCAACACRVSAADTWEDDVLLADVPNVELLSADRARHPPTAELPRDALTTVESPAGSGERYCMAPDGVTGVSNGELLVRLCGRCHGKLSRGAVPQRSLVRVDTGPWPADDVGPLPLLSQVEEALVAPVTVHSRVYIMRAAQERSSSTFTMKKTLVGHVVVMPGPATDDLAALLPRSYGALADKFLVRKVLALWVHLT